MRSALNIETIILHVVGGTRARGGDMSYVNQITQTDCDSKRQLIWKHRAFSADSGGRHVCRGLARLTNMSWGADIVGGLLDFVPLLLWRIKQRKVILVAHSRSGILAAGCVRLLTQTPLIVVHHTLASRPRIYHLLWRLFGAHAVFNSLKTCRHFGCEPNDLNVIPPAIEWPKTSPSPRSGKVRFYAAGAFVPVKRLDVLIKTFKELALPNAELHIFGLSPTPLDPVYQRFIIELAADTQSIHLLSWNSNWTIELKAGDRFVHVGNQESFGLVILEAFAHGCGLLVPNGTFLDDFPEPYRSNGIVRFETITAAEIARCMEISLTHACGDLWEIRKPLNQLFSIDASASKWSNVYSFVAQSRGSGREGS